MVVGTKAGAVGDRTGSLAVAVAMGVDGAGCGPIQTASTPVPSQRPLVVMVGVVGVVTFDVVIVAVAVVAFVLAVVALASCGMVVAIIRFHASLSCAASTISARLRCRGTSM